MKKRSVIILQKLVLYIILIGLGFVYLYPVLYMISLSFMGQMDLINPSIQWIPAHFTLDNFSRALQVLRFWETLGTTVFIVAVSALLQTFSASLTGYALARFNFPFKRLWMILVLATFIIPVNVSLVPRFILFNNYGIINTAWALFLPAFFGQGLKSAIFILIFYQFFNSYPKALDEAAQIDGAGRLKVFYRIAIPMCVPAIVVSLLFSVVWNWNETSQTAIFVGQSIQTLPMRLQSFVTEFTNMFPADQQGHGVNHINESIRMAGTLLTILPLVILYAFLQKRFVESVESTGITGE